MDDATLRERLWQGFARLQAVLALARRRVNVLWALLRDNRPFTLTPPAIPSTT